MADIWDQAAQHTSSPSAPPAQAGKDIWDQAADSQPLSFWDSLKAALPHPIDSLKEWFNRPSEVGKAMDALAVYNKIAAENPANKGLPPGKQKMLREPTPEEQAVIERGMHATLPGAEGNALSDAAGPGVTAAQQVGAGNLPGAAGTLVGGYVAPAAAAAAVPYVPPAARAAVKFVDQPGTGTILKGVAKTAGGVKVALMGGPEGLVGGGAVASSGVADVVKGLGKRAEAAAKLQKAADAAAADAKAAAANTGPNPYAGGVATAATIDPAAAAASPPMAPVAVQAPYFRPASTGPLPAPPAPPARFNPYVGTNDPAALAATQGPLPAPTALSVNPYAAGSGTSVAPAAPPAAAPPQAAAPAIAPPAAPAPVETAAPAATPYDGSAEALAAKYKAAAANADEVKAQWMFNKGITSDQLKPGSEFKALVDQIPNPNAKSGKFTTRVNDADHPLRVKAVADLLDSKHANAASVKMAAQLASKGVTLEAAKNMTPAQLGVADAKGAADVRFQLQQLENKRTPASGTP